MYIQLTLYTLSSRAKKQGEQNRRKHTLLITFGLKHLALIRDIYLLGRLGQLQQNFGGQLCLRLLHFRNRAILTSRRSIYLSRNIGQSLFIYGNHQETGLVQRQYPFCLKHYRTPLIDLLKEVSFVREISPLEDLTLLLRKQGLTHFSTYQIRCKGRPAYITVNKPLTLSKLDKDFQNYRALF